MSLSDLLALLTGPMTGLLGLIFGKDRFEPQGIAADDDRFDEKDYWYDWDRNDWEAFWANCDAIEAAFDQGPDAAAAEAERLGLPDIRAYSRVKATFVRHFGEDPEFNQIVVRRRMARSQAQMRAAATPDLLEPIEGVSIALYATLAARLAAVDGDHDAFHALLAEHDLDAAVFDRVQAAWQHRMRSAEDPMATAALVAEYGKHFAAAGQGAFGSVGQVASASMGIDAVKGGPVAGPAPCTPEQYARMLGAQGAWADDGRDIHALLRSEFGLTAMDWCNLGMYWNQRIQADSVLARTINTLSEKFRGEYRTAHPADADLVL